MKLNNKTCIVCRTTYSYCPSCPQYKNLPTWMVTFHDENCKTVFDGICAYTLNNDIVKAKEMLSKCDLSVVKNMTEKNQNFVAEIMGTNIESEVPVDEPETIAVEEKEEMIPEVLETVEEPVQVEVDEVVKEITSLETDEVVEESVDEELSSPTYPKKNNRNRKR